MPGERSCVNSSEAPDEITARVLPQCFCGVMVDRPDDRDLWELAWDQ